MMTSKRKRDLVGVNAEFQTQTQLDNVKSSIRMKWLSRTNPQKFPYDKS